MVANRNWQALQLQSKLASFYGILLPSEVRKIIVPTKTRKTRTYNVGMAIFGDLIVKVQDYRRVRN